MSGGVIVPDTTRNGSGVWTGAKPGPVAVIVRGPVWSLARISNCAMKVRSARGNVGAAAAVMPGDQVSRTGTPGGKSKPRTDVTKPGLPMGGTATILGRSTVMGALATLSAGLASVPVVRSVPRTVVRSGAFGASTTATTWVAPEGRSGSAHPVRAQPGGTVTTGIDAGSAKSSRSPVARPPPPLRTV